MPGTADQAKAALLHLRGNRVMQEGSGRLSLLCCVLAPAWHRKSFSGWKMAPEPAASSLASCRAVLGIQLADHCGSVFDESRLLTAHVPPLQASIQCPSSGTKSTERSSTMRVQTSCACSTGEVARLEASFSGLYGNPACIQCCCLLLFPDHPVPAACALKSISLARSGD